MIVVHHLGVSQSERIVWLCEELQIPYELRLYQRDPETMLAPAEYKKLHPLGTAPVISDGDLVLAESGAIIEYLINRHGGGRLSVKPEQPNYADYLFWFHFANGSLMPNLMAQLVSQLAGGSSDDNAALASLTKRKQISFDLIEKRLGEASYFAGEEFTAADLIMLFPLTTMSTFTPVDVGQYPHLTAYLKRVTSRPAYQRAMAREHAST